jgi:acetylornithine deacetylase/succinyl-diaminopimelate desuccinylase-like protein
MRTLIIFLAMASAAFGADYPVNWSKVREETLRHFVALIQMDTTNPPGNETKAARYVEQVLKKEGINAKLLGPDQDRLNVVARMIGDGSKQPLLIMGHTDVVGVQREKWTVDPFSGTRKDGYIYGRGAVDDKDNVAAGLMVMLLLKRHGVQLSRDVIFVAESGEESGAQAGTMCGTSPCRLRKSRGPASVLWPGGARVTRPSRFWQIPSLIWPGPLPAWRSGNHRCG